MVSIVLPVYNGERYLGEAIASVRRQTHPQWELIIVNDGSTDGSRAAALRHAGEDARIRLIDQPNRKLPAALSAGFRAARGDYFTWTSADNRLRPEFLTRLLGEFREHPDWDMVTADMQMIDARGEPLRGSDCIRRFQDPVDTSIVHYPDDLGIMEREVCNVVGGAFLYRAECGRRLGDYDDRYFTAEDYDYWLRMLACFTVRHAGFRDPIYEYRFHPEALSARAEELGIDALTRQLLTIHRKRKPDLAKALPPVRSSVAKHH